MKGSKYAIIKLVESSNFIDRINDLLKGTKAKISVYDNWMPKSVHMDKEAELNDFLKHNFSSELHEKITNWWLYVDATTPNWDLISTCMFDGQRGILLVEAKAHSGELNNESHGKDPKELTSEDSVRNHIKIGTAVNEAKNEINKNIAGVNISRDQCYQLSNRVAHAWWLASQGIPVVLMYLGFLNAKDMDDGKNKIFKDEDAWKDCFTRHSEQVGVDKIVDKWVKCGEAENGWFKLIMKSS
jgi:hypothetical protein